MGLFSRKQADTPAAASTSAETSSGTAAAAAASTGAPAEKPPALTPEQELELLVAGAPNMEEQVRAEARFIGSNTRHMYADGALGLAVYTFSGLQHIQGQSNALTLLSMWAAGTTFLINFALRKFLTEQAHSSTALDTTAAAASVNAERPGDANKTAAMSPAETAALAKTMKSVTGSNVDLPTATTSAATATVAAAAGLVSDVEWQRKNIFQLEMVGSWVWMLASFQQFRVHKRLKWCGYSSWTGLTCVFYYTMRHMYNVLVA